ncbi:hypothetical protein [Candidatus Rhodobacter oscarellae]|uniref:hypothetical protein n=1 Tax=Candidatus Rhodobacter oscarellae TaxID=1675527 RepID=UPI000671538E|nr:hypothetical protein [Candidatus Rhodobacter lobularis]
MRPLAVLVAMVALPASSQEMQLLRGAELSELFGTHQFGYEANSGLRVDECIEPSGQTVYRTYPEGEIYPYSNPGQMAISDLDQACFTYPTIPAPGPYCYWVFRNGDGYVFQQTDFGARFVIDRVQRGVRDCPEPGELLSYSVPREPNSPLLAARPHAQKVPRPRPLPDASS